MPQNDRNPAGPPSVYDHTGMNVDAIAEEIYQYTSGYLYLVSAVCKILDEKRPEYDTFENGRKVWTREGTAGAVKILLNKKSPLFDSMIRQLDTYKDLRD